MQVLTMTTARKHLRITHTADDDNIMRKAEAAERVVFNYMGYDDLDAWYADHGEIIPFAVEAAMLLALTVLYKHDAPRAEPITPAVKQLVQKYRTPTITDIG